MSAAEVIKQIKALPAAERAVVKQFFAEDADNSPDREFSVAVGNDGLPVIRTNGGSITSRLVHEIESQ